MNDDLISREDLKKVINKFFGTVDFVILDDIITIIDNAPTVERSQGEWIPVSERLPEESLNSVIGWDTYRERCVFVQYIDGHFQITGRAESFNIVAWRPLPEPYKKGEEE